MLARSSERDAASGQHLSRAVRRDRWLVARSARSAMRFKLTQFGVNLVTLAPGSWSSQRHWHAKEDEFIYVLQGEVTLVTNAGQKTLTAGMAAGFPAGKADGHHLINQSDKPALYLEVGTRAVSEEAHYSDIDMIARKEGGRFVFTHKNGDPYP